MSETKSGKLCQGDYLYWIHCNKCFTSYTNKQCRLFLLACQHVACEKCLKSTKDANTGICPICNKIAHVRQLGNDLPSNIKQLFHPRPWQDGLPSVDIVQFQQKHRNNLLQYEQRKTSEYNNLQQSCAEARAKARENFALLENARQERKSLEAQVRKVLKQRRATELEQCAPSRIPPTSPSTTTEESNIIQSNFSRRPRYPSPRFQQRPILTGANSLVPNEPRMVRPQSVAASFSDFAYVDNSFTL